MKICENFLVYFIVSRNIFASFMRFYISSHLYSVLDYSVFTYNEVVTNEYNRVGALSCVQK